MSENVINPPRLSSSVEKQDMGSVGEGVIGITSKPKEKPAIVDNSKGSSEKVAVYSSGNFSISGIGSISKGYSILNKATADKWLSKTSRVRIATPEEIMKEYGL